MRLQDTSTSSPFGPVALSPGHFLERSAVVHGDEVAVVEGDHRRTYADLADRCRRLAGGLGALGVTPGDRVSTLTSNTSMALEAHFGVQWAAAVLNPLNTRLSVDELAYIVGHAGSRVLLVDHELEQIGRELGARLDGLMVVVAGTPESEYEALLRASEPTSEPVMDEHDLVSLNYTSGTTGRPKGVMYSHRGAYLQSLAMVAHSGLGVGDSFLWTLPMFHCNGWCFPWAVTAAGATHVTLRRPEPAAIWRAVRTHGITHFNAAPTVLSDFAYCAEAEDGPAPRQLKVATGGAPPAPRLLARLAELNVHVTHLYGLTETYGPAAVCEWRPSWSSMDAATQARLRARQGVENLVGERIRVVDESGRDVPADGESAGEVVVRGNNVTVGYYRDRAATAAANLDGWFRTGDAAVMHPDGYIELRDRLKDVIISGGENIASIEVEHALQSHPAVLECAVVGRPDERWGEVPVAFVVLREGASVDAEELIAHVKGRLARFKAPKEIRFEDLPKTATGKIQKFVLRERFAQDSQQILRNL